MRFTPLFLAGLVSIGAVVPSFAAAEELDSRGNTQYEIDIISPGNAFRSTDSNGEIALESGAGKNSCIPSMMQVHPTRRPSISIYPQRGKLSQKMDSFMSHLTV